MGECSIDLITTTIIDLVYASAGIIFQRNRALDYTLAILHITYMSTYYSTGRTAGRQRPVDRPHPGAIVPLPLSPPRTLCAFTSAPVPPAPAPSLHAPPRHHPPRSHMSRSGPLYPRTPRPHSLDHGATGTLTPCEAFNMGPAWWLQEGSTSVTNSCPTWRVRACVRACLGTGPPPPGRRRWAAAAGLPPLGVGRRWAATAGQSPRYLKTTSPSSGLIPVRSFLSL